MALHVAVAVEVSYTSRLNRHGRERSIQGRFEKLWGPCKAFFWAPRFISGQSVITNNALDGG